MSSINVYAEPIRVIWQPWLTRQGQAGKRHLNTLFSASRINRLGRTAYASLTQVSGNSSRRPARDGVVVVTASRLCVAERHIGANEQAKKIRKLIPHA
jgi:hypothetical protein